MKLTTAASLLLAAVARPVLSSSDGADRSHSHSCDAACDELARELGDRVSLPQSAVYELEESHYWSLQQATQRPTCRVTPTSSSDVSVTIKSLRKHQCQFAVKSGGHASFAGASNIGPGGVAIDLGSLTGLEVSDDRKTAAVGAGKLWTDVYAELDPQNLSAIGGRSGGIGVGGLTLGGGISFFSGRYGWACDNVNGYEIVLADGSIEYVTYDSNPDLFFALRGGGNNFGIVTRFDLAIFEQGQMWGGQVTYSADDMTALNEGLYHFNIHHHDDPYGALILAYVYVPALQMYIASVDLEYGKPEANPAILANFTALPSLQSSTRITTMTDLAVELNNTQPSGLRETFWTFTTRNDVEIMAQIQDLFKSMVPSIEDAADLLPALVFQPISTAMTTHFTSKGGNALGITPEDGPLLLIDISIAWSDNADDDRIMDFASTFIRRGQQMAKCRHLDFPYIYQNYAAAAQEVFPSYGKKNHDRLKAIHHKVDPTGVFTKLQPGYFKI